MVDVTHPDECADRQCHANGVVNASDVAFTKAQLGQSVAGSNFRTDANAAHGFINATEVALVKAAIRTALP